MERMDGNIINPEIPETPAERLALLRLCIDALAAGRVVEGVTPRHITIEGMRMLNQYRGNTGSQSAL